MTLPADQQRKEALFGPRESRHVRMLGNVRTVSLVTVVGNIQADLVQPGRPVKDLAGDLLEKPHSFLHCAYNSAAVRATRSACCSSTW